MNYRKLEVYRYAIRFLTIADRIIRSLPSGYGSFADQLRRSSLSVPLNIAEGSGRTTPPDQRPCYAIARGSAMECAAIIDALIALELIEASEAETGCETLNSIARMLSRMALTERP